MSENLHITNTDFHWSSQHRSPHHSQLRRIEWSVQLVTHIHVHEERCIAKTCFSPSYKLLDIHVCDYVRVLALQISVLTTFQQAWRRMTADKRILND